MALLVAPLVFGAPEGPVAVCAGGRRPAREPSAPRASLGASTRSPARPRHRPPAPRQLPPAPSTPAALEVCWVARRVVSKPGQAPPPPTGTAAAPSGALHTGGAWSLIGGSVLCLETRPDLAFAPQASCPALAHIAAESTPNFARNSPVTLSNIEFKSLELQRFQSLLKLRPIELRAKLRGLVSAMARELVHWLPIRCNALPG